MKKSIYIFFCFFLLQIINAQENNKVFERHFTKEKKILFRIVPENKKMFELIKSNGLKITRYTLTNNTQTNETVINDFLHPYWETDSAKWLPLFRKDKNKTGFIYNAIFQNKGDTKLSPQQKEKHEKMVYDLMLLSCDFNAEVASACGLFFADSTIASNSNYVYKIAVYTTTTSTMAKEIYSVTLNSSILSTNKKITGLDARSKNKISTLKWKAIDYKSDYSGYNIERSEDSVTYKRINSTPIILLSSQFEKNKEYIFFNDTMPQSNKKYFYRLRGINFFGEESEPSNIINVYSSPPVNSVPFIDSVFVVQNRRVNIKWRMENNFETPLLKNYLLLRADKDNGIYKTIYESKENLKYTDLEPRQSNFYKVAAITHNNDTIYSYSRMATIIDTIPPSPPNNLKATVDKKGIVTLQWQKNNETDLQGYKLFKANALNEEFVQINNKFITDTIYTDKLNLKTLTKKIYYSLAASDNNFNTSITCSSIEVKRPDTIPPAAPLLNSLYPELKGVKLNFILSKSDDVIKHIISRKTGNENFTVLKELTIKDSIGIYMDTTAESGKTYSYQVTAFDEDNNSSVSKCLVIKYQTGYRKKLNNLAYKVDRTQKNISLTWEYNEKEIEKFILYRAKANEQLTIIKTVNGKTLSYTDNNLNIGNIYEYRIKAVLYNGDESIISDAVKVEY
jgi:glycerophosphoryl diester phosphodiesterase